MYNVYIKSKWSELKPEAVALRKHGKSLPYVHDKLGIPKSTLSHWFKDIILTEKQKEKLQKNWQNALVKARTKAVEWHNQEKYKRLKTTELESLSLLSQIDKKNTNVIELALALLYLGEGTKSQAETGMGSSDPLILNFLLLV